MSATVKPKAEVSISQECCFRVTKSIQGLEWAGTVFTQLDSILKQCWVLHTSWEECITSSLKVSGPEWHQTFLWKFSNCAGAEAGNRNIWESEKPNALQGLSGPAKHERDVRLLSVYMAVSLVLQCELEQPVTVPIIKVQLLTVGIILWSTACSVLIRKSWKVGI